VTQFRRRLCGAYLNPACWTYAPASPLGSSFLLRPPKLVELARCAHPDFDRVGFEAPVLRLPRVAGHRDGLIADVLDLVDRARLGERPAGSVVTDEFGGQAGAPQRYGY